MIPTWVFYIAFSALLASASYLLDRFILRNVNDALAFGLITRAGAAVLFLLYFAFVSKPVWPTDAFTWGLIVLATAFWTIAAVLDFQALGTAELTLSAPLRRLRLLFVMLLAMLFLSEALTWLKLAAFVLVIVGAVIASSTKGVQFNEFKRQPVVRLLILFALTAGLAATLDKVILTRISDPQAYAFLNFFLSIFPLALIVTNPASRIKQFIHSKPATLVASIILTALLSAFWVSGLSTAPVGQGLIVYEINLPLTFLGSALILGEKTNWKRRATGSAIVLAGVILAAIA